jgi:hypothetical protein
MAIARAVAAMSAPDHLIEDAASAAIVRILERDRFWDGRGTRSGFGYHSAVYGVREFLRNETGKQQSVRPGQFLELWEDITANEDIPADTLLHIARRADAIDAAGSGTLTVAQRRGNMPGRA